MHSIRPFIYLGPLLAIGFMLWRNSLHPSIRHWVDWRYASVIGLAATGYVAPNIWVYYGLAFAIVALLPRSRVEAAGLFITVSFMVPLADFIVFMGTSRVVNLDMIQVAALGLLTSLRFPAPRARGTGGLTAIDAAFIGLLAVQLVIACRVPNFAWTIGTRAGAQLIMSLAIPYFIISRLAFDEEGLRRVLHYFAMAGFILAIVAMFEMMRRWPLYSAIDNNLHTAFGRSRSLAVRAGMMRAPGPFMDSTGFGMFLAMATTVLAANRNLFRTREAHIFAIGVACCGAFATLARGGWIGLVLGLILIGVYWGRAYRTVVVGMVTGVALMLALMVAPADSKVAGLLGSSGAGEGTATYRQDLFHYGSQLVVQRPLVGWPIVEANGVLKPYLRSNNLSTDWVNSYLFFAVAAGLGGFLLLLCYSLSPVVTALRARARLTASRTEREMAAALFAAGLAFAIIIGFLSYMERVPLMGLLLVAGARQLQVARVRRGAAVPAATGGVEAGAVQPRASRPLVVDPMRPVWTHTRAPSAQAVPALPPMPVY